jgi:pre-rRNA-processing protein TSR1
LDNCKFNSFLFYQDLPSDTKSRQELKKAVVSFVSPELPEDSKFYPAETKEDLHTVICLFFLNSKT